MGETPSYKHSWKRGQPSITLACSGDLAPPNPVLPVGQCKVYCSPQSLFSRSVPPFLFFYPSIPGFVSSSHTVQLWEEHQTVPPFSSSIPNPRAHGHPLEHITPPASPRSHALPLCQATVLQHILHSETADIILGGVTESPVGSRIFAQTLLQPLTAAGAHRCQPKGYLCFIQPHEASQSITS